MYLRKLPGTTKLPLLEASIAVDSYKKKIWTRWIQHSV